MTPGLREIRAAPQHQPTVVIDACHLQARDFLHLFITEMTRDELFRHGLFTNS
jgi:hypothetical protein